MATADPSDYDASNYYYTQFYDDDTGSYYENYILVMDGQ